MSEQGPAQERTRPAMDGRRLRSQRSRERILDAVAEALADPDVDLSPAGVAARAGVSVSTIARHFGDRDGLVAALRDRVRSRLLPLLSAGPFEGGLRTRIHELVRRRTEMFEIVAPLYRAAPRQRRPPARARRERERLEEFFLLQLTQALGPELEATEDRKPVLAALLSFGSWNHMRTVQNLDAARTGALLERTALAVLESHGRRR
ncbi:MAG: TetR/AcrR family transcriptional regulator [Gemmatimonadota bacterium]|nr:TetR/AcrR family transcriptional regulator [Gemmatimonadota bacterium]